MTRDQALAVLEEILEFLGDQADVYDGSDGQPRPNTAMRLSTELEQVIETLQ
jgi:hypothetical protein